MNIWSKSAIVCMASILSLIGCNNDYGHFGKTTAEEKQEIFAEIKEIAEFYEEIYKNAEQENTLDTLETKQEIVKCIGKNGYSATDTENEIDMVNAEPVEMFCEKAQENKSAEVRILLITDIGSMVCYDLFAENGEIWVKRSSVLWTNRKMQTDYFEEFKAYEWNYSEEGVLYIEQYRPEGYDGASGETQIRVKPMNLETRERIEKGYDLPIDEQTRERAETECFETMNQCQEYFEQNDVEKMLSVIERMENAVTSKELRENMRNFEYVENFLRAAEEGKKCEIIFYDIHKNNGITQYQLEFDGTQMYALVTIGIWDEENVPYISEVSYTRIKEWEYTEKGWFSFEYCVPEYPDVTEVVIGENLFRIKPQNEEYRDIAEKYLLPLSYQGNNLLQSDWNEEKLENLDYNALYQYFYEMESGRKFELDLSENGVQAEVFEEIMTKYLPVTKEQLRKYAVYDEEEQKYAWAELGCGTYTPNSFGTSFPEITNIEENADGSLTLTVDAVCERVGNDAVISHKLIVEIGEEGSVKYLGNQVLNDGLENIPEYEYRCTR